VKNFAEMLLEDLRAHAEEAARMDELTIEEMRRALDRAEEARPRGLRRGSRVLPETSRRG
jgi:hypothetical protein